MAFSSDQVVIIDSILSPFFARFMILPFEISCPIHLCAFVTTLSCDANFGTKRSVIEIIKDNAGMILPNR